MDRIRVKNFSTEPIEFDWVNVWRPRSGPGFIQIVEKRIMEPGEMTGEFDPDDPFIQRMLKIHPELRPYVAPSVWERLRRLPKPEF